MNDLLQNYCVSVELPDCSGLEHLEMLENRDRLAELETNLTKIEKQKLALADFQLIEKAREFYSEISRFVNLAAKRQSEEISPHRWWWYLDVLSSLPISFVAQEAEIRENINI